MQSHPDWHGRTNPSTGHKDQSPHRSQQSHGATYASDLARQGYPQSSQYDSYYTRSDQDRRRSRWEERSPRRRSRDRSTHGRHRDSRRRSRERRPSRSPHRRSRRPDSDRDHGTTSRRGNDSQQSRGPADQAPPLPSSSSSSTDNKIPPLLPPTEVIPQQGRPHPRRPRGKRHGKGATTSNTGQASRGTKRKRTDKSDEAAKRLKAGEILPQDLAEWVLHCAVVQHNKHVLLDCQNGLRENKGIDALLTPLDTQLRPPFPDTAFRRHMREIKEQTKNDIVQALLHLYDRNQDTLNEIFPAIRGVGPCEPRLERGLTLAKKAISRIHPDTASTVTTIAQQLADARESNRVRQHDASGLRATTSGLPPALDNIQQVPASRASSHTGDDSGSTASSSDSANTASEQASRQPSSSIPERTEFQAVSKAPSSTASRAPDRTEQQPKSNKREKEKTGRLPERTESQGSTKQPASATSHKQVTKIALDLRVHLPHITLPPPLMATTTGAWAQITHGQFEEDKVLSPGDTYRVISSLNNYNEQEDAAARELLARVLKFRKKKHNVREVGGTTDPLTLENPQRLQWQEHIFATARHAVEWEKCKDALGLSDTEVDEIFTKQRTGEAIRRAVMPLINANKAAKNYWHQYGYASKVRWLTRKALTQNLTLEELLRDDYEGFITRAPEAANTGVDIYAVTLWHVRHDLQRFAWYVDNEWEISGDPAIALASYPHKEDVVGREIVAHFMTKANQHLIPPHIWTPSAVCPDTDFDMSGSPAASPLHEDLLAPTSAKKVKQQGIRLRTEAQREKLLGHSSQSDTSDREDASGQRQLPANGSELQTATGKVTDNTAKTYKEHIAMKGNASNTSTTTATTTTVPKAKRQLSLPKPRTPDGGSVYDKHSKRSQGLIDGTIDPALLKSRPVGRMSYREPSSSEASLSDTSSSSSSDDTGSKATNQSQDQTRSASEGEEPHTDNELTHSQVMSLLDKSQETGPQGPSQPTSTSTPNPQGPATQSQFSSSNEEALLKCLESAERTEFSTENRPPGSTSKAEREIHHGSERTKQATNEGGYRQPDKAETSPYQSDQDMAKTEATEQTSSKAQTQKKHKKKKSKKSKKEKRPEHDTAKTATRNPEKSDSRPERTELAAKETTKELSPGESTTFPEGTEQQSILIDDTDPKSEEDENSLTFWSRLDLVPDGCMQPGDDITVIEETPPDQIPQREAEPPAQPANIIPNISLQIKPIQPEWKKPVEYIPTPITRATTTTTTSISGTRQEDSTEAQSPTKGLLAIKYTPTVWNDQRQIPLGPCQGTVNFIIGDQRVADFHTLYTCTGPTVLRAIKAATALQLANHMQSQQMHYPEAQCAVILVPNSDLPQASKEGEEDDNPHIRSGRWGPVTRGMKSLIKAAFEAFPRAAVTFLLPDVSPCTKAADGTEIEDQAMDTYRQKFKRCLATEGAASAGWRSTNVRATRLGPGHFRSEPPYSLNSKGTNAIVMDIKSILSRHHFRTTGSTTKDLAN